MGIVFGIVYLTAVWPTIRLKNYDAAIGFGICGVVVIANTYLLWKLFGKSIKDALRRKGMGEHGEEGNLIYPVNKTSGFEDGDRTETTPLLEVAVIDMDAWPMRRGVSTILVVASAIFAVFSLGMSLFYLIMGAAIDKQSWTGDSDFVPFVAWLATFKWCVITARMLSGVHSSS